MSVDGENAVVEIQRVSACTGDCKDCAGCETKKMQITAQAMLQVKVGDRVRVVSEGKSVLFGMFVLFILPLFLPAVSYLLTAKSGFGIWFALGTLILAIILIWLLSRSSWYLKRTYPQIVEVMLNKKGNQE